MISAPLGPAIETRGLRKSYPTGFLYLGRRVVLEDLSLTVPRGGIFGYLGPNGSGKTTTLKLLLGLVFPDTGTASILGEPITDRGWRQRVGYLPEHPYLYDYLTAAEYLEYVGRLFGLRPGDRRERARDLLSRVGLLRSADVPLRNFSKGMVQRAGLAQALMNDPELLILDEPMSGLDPVGRRLVRELILDLKRRGKTIFFSTHILFDAETLCDRVALLRAGRLKSVGRLDEILELNVAQMEVYITGIPPDALDRLPPEVKRMQPMGERWRLDVEEGQLVNVLRAVELVRGRVLSVQPIRQSLEEFFFREMQSEKEGAAWIAEE